jgi:hypothetical protein
MSNEFAEVIKQKYLGKIVEIYQGETQDTRLQAEIENSTKSILYGKVVDVIGPAIMLESRRGDKIHIVMINAWSIKTICESSIHVSLYDIYWADVDLANQKRKGKIVA